MKNLGWQFWFSIIGGIATTMLYFANVKSDIAVLQTDVKYIKEMLKERLDGPLWSQKGEKWKNSSPN